MKDVVITIENLTKVYKLYANSHDRLKEALSPLRRKYHQDFYALNNLTFNIKKGETVGIIGRNGSGKSTFLKIITGVLSPTLGSVKVAGKISALLELGAGFNMDYTGLENIYLNGTIMGYSKEAMDNKLQAILDFADIGDYVYQKVKTYSSGMFVRLAFAVAINVDPDILIVDEALAVGDIRFQQKCYRKIKEFRDEGKTILFVSHDMGAIKNFCDRVIWLKNGAVLQTGSPEVIVKKYISEMTYDAETMEGKREHKKPGLKDHLKAKDTVEWEDVGACSSFGEGGAQITRVVLCSKESDEKLKIFEGGQQVRFLVEVKANQDLLSPGVGILLNDEYGNHIFTINTYAYWSEIRPLHEGEKVVVGFEFEFPLLKNGNYSFTVAVSEGTQESHIQHHWVHDAYVIQLSSPDVRAALGCYLIIDEVNIAINDK